MPTAVATETLLIECAKLLNELGPDSPEIEVFISCHLDDPEFVELARLSRGIKRVLMSEEDDEPNPVAVALQCMRD